MQFVDLKTQYKQIEKKIKDRIDKVLEHGMYINGPEIQELESQLAEFIGVKHSIGCANGTDALTIAMLALNIQPGDEIISTPFTFFATGETVALAGAKLVFADINPETYNIDPTKIEEKITSKTKAIIPVSLYGQMAEMNAIMQIADKFGIPVIEDAAQSFGAMDNKGRYSGAVAHISTTSFFPAKPLGCYGDGGALFTNDDELAMVISQIRNHGQSVRYKHTRLGVNSRLDSIQAGILIEKLKIFGQELEARNQVANRYDELLGDKVKKMKVLSGYSCSWAQYTLEVENRTEFQNKMKEQGIPTAVHYPVPLHYQPVFSNLGYNKGDYPIAEAASEKVVSLPMHPYLDLKTQTVIVDAVLNSL